MKCNETRTTPARSEPDKPTRSVTLGEARRALASIPAPDGDFAADLEDIRATQLPAPIGRRERDHSSE